MPPGVGPTLVERMTTKPGSATAGDATSTAITDATPTATDAYDIQDRRSFFTTGTVITVPPVRPIPGQRAVAHPQ